MPKPQSQLEYKQLPVYIETVDEEQGIVNAVPAVMGNVDYQGDRIWKGAFTKTIQERGAKVRILDNHNAMSTLDVVGRIMSLREIDKGELPPELLMQFPEAIGGLSASVQFLMDTPEGLGVFKRLKAGAITEWSIGYDAVDKDHERIEIEGEEIVVRNLKQIRLYELSPVIWGANPATMTVSAKAADSTDVESGTPTESKPWRVEEREGEFCVFKLDDDGNLDGEALKCYADEAEAIAYLRALYANVEDARDNDMDRDEKLAAAYDADVQANEDAAAYYKQLLDTHPELKEGRVLSARNAQRIIGAMTSLLDTLEAAGLDMPGWEKQTIEDDDKTSTYLVAIKRCQDRKAESLDARIRQVRDAFYEQHRPAGAEMQAIDPSPYWVQEVYPSFVIVEDGAQLYAYPYTIDITTGNISFGERYPVEVTYIRLDTEKSSAPTQGRADDDQLDEKAGPGACPPTNSDMLAQAKTLELELSLLEVT